MVHPAPVFSFGKQLWGIYLVPDPSVLITRNQQERDRKWTRAFKESKDKEMLYGLKCYCSWKHHGLATLRLKNKPPTKPFLKRKKKILRAVFSSLTYCRCFPLSLAPSSCLRCSKLSHFWGEAIPKAQDSEPLILSPPLSIVWASNMKKIPFFSLGSCRYLSSQAWGQHSHN